MDASLGNSVIVQTSEGTYANIDGMYMAATQHGLLMESRHKNKMGEAAVSVTSTLLLFLLLACLFESGCHGAQVALEVMM